MVKTLHLAKRRSKLNKHDKWPRRLQYIYIYIYIYIYTYIHKSHKPSNLYMVFIVVLPNIISNWHIVHFLPPSCNTSTSGNPLISSSFRWDTFPLDQSRQYQTTIFMDTNTNTVLDLSFNLKPHEDHLHTCFAKKPQLIDKISIV